MFTRRLSWYSIIHDKDLILDSVSNLWQHKIVEGATKSSPRLSTILWRADFTVWALPTKVFSMKILGVTLTPHLDTLWEFSPWMKYSLPVPIRESFSPQKSFPPYWLLIMIFLLTVRQHFDVVIISCIEVMIARNRTGYQDCGTWKLQIRTLMFHSPWKVTHWNKMGTV